MNCCRPSPGRSRKKAGRWRERINDEVDTIVLKALSKDKLRRYETAGTLKQDIAHYLAGEPIEAKRDSASDAARSSGSGDQCDAACDSREHARSLISRR